MQKLIYLYKQLFFLQISPEALPYSKSLLWGSILSYFLISVLAFELSGQFSLSANVLAHTGTIFLSIVFVYILLKIQNIQVRLHKILLALFSVDLVFLIISFILRPLDVNIQLMLALVCMFWSLAIKTHIFSKGLDVNRINAIIVMISFEVIRHLPIVFLIRPYLMKLG